MDGGLGVFTKRMNKSIVNGHSSPNFHEILVGTWQHLTLPGFSNHYTQPELLCL